MRNKYSYEEHSIEKFIADKGLVLSGDQVRKLRIPTQEELKMYPVETMDQTELYYKLIERISNQDTAKDILSRIWSRAGVDVSRFPPYRELIKLIRDQKILKEFQSKLSELKDSELKTDIAESIQKRIQLIQDNGAEHIQYITVEAQEEINLAGKQVYGCRLKITGDRSKVKRLILRNNCLGSGYDLFDWTVPESLFDFPNLEELDLSENYIMVLPEAIRNLKKLKRVNLTGNYFSYLPSGIRELPELEKVLLEDNYFYSSGSHKDVMTKEEIDAYEAQKKAQILEGNILSQTSNQEVDRIALRNNQKIDRSTGWKLAAAVILSAIGYVLYQQSSDTNPSPVAKSGQKKILSHSVAPKGTQTKSMIGSDISGQHTVKQGETLWNIYGPKSLQIALDNNIDLFVIGSDGTKQHVHTVKEAMDQLSKNRIVIADIQPSTIIQEKPQ